MRMSGSELIKHSHRATHEHKIGEDSIKKESKKQESLPNNFHIEKERGCGEPLDTYTNDSLDYPQFQRPTPIKSVFVKKKKQGTNSKALHGKACDDRANTNNSEEGRYDGGNVLNTSNVLDSTEIDACRSSLIVDQSEPASERVVSSNDDLNKTPERPHELLTEDKQENAQSAGHDAKAGNAKMVVDILQEKESSSSRGRPRKEKQIIKCEYCGRPFNHASAYVIHRRVHTGEKPFSCQDCGKAFAQLSNLRSHSKIHNAPKTLSMQLSSRSRSRATATRRMTENQLNLTPDLRNECHDKSIIPLSRSRTPVACPICGKVFPYRSVLKIHLRIHSGEKPYACKVCGKAFTQACTVRVHERVHWSVKPFLCSKCGKGFSQIGTLKAHTCQGKKHTHSTLKEMELTGVVIFRCHLCKKCFNTREDYDLHLQTHTDSHRYICDSCGQTYSLRSELDTHRKYCFSMWLSKTKSYNRQPSVKLQNKNVESSETVQDTQTANIAQLMPIKSPSPSPSKPSQQEHQTKPNKTLQSGVSQSRKCKKYLSLLTCPPKVMASSMYDSQNSHDHCQPFRTSYFVSQLNSLDQKSDPRKYMCPRCGRFFRHVGRLRAHMLTHAQGKSFTCGHCGKILENWSKFWRHQRLHKQRQGRFFCPKCGRGFRFVSIYMQHLQQHPELNAYFCPLCPHTFSNAVNLKNHLQEWHQSSMPHICDICGKGFANPIILKRHRVTHCFKSTQVDTPFVTDVQSVMKPYECGKCDASFKSLDLLFNHQFSHSPKGDLSLNLSNGNYKQLTNFVGKSRRRSPHHKDDLNLNSDSTSNPDTSRPNKYIRHGSPSTTIPTDMIQTQTLQEVHNSVPQRSMPVLSTGSESEERKKSVKCGKMNKGLSDPTTEPEQSRGLLECAECSACFALLPALHEHYLEHARGKI